MTDEDISLDEITDKKDVVPLGPREKIDRKKIDLLIAEMDDLAHEVGKKWPKSISAVDAVRDQRR